MYAGCLFVQIRKLLATTSIDHTQTGRKLEINEQKPPDEAVGTVHKRWLTQCGKRRPKRIDTS